MNYRIGDIIEIMHENKLVTAKIVSVTRGQKSVKVILHNSNRIEGKQKLKSIYLSYLSYPKELVKMEDIIRVVKRKRGKKYKKKYNIILIDKNGKIIDE